MKRRIYLVRTTAIVSAISGCTTSGGDDAGGDSESSAPSESTSVDGTDPSATGREGTQNADLTAEPSAADTTIVLANTAFNPVQAEVDVGGTVEWVNNDGFDHDVTAAQFNDSATFWEFEQTISDGQRVLYTFDKPGVYEYYCTIHGREHMCGVVLVGDVTRDTSLPCGVAVDDDY